MGKVEICIGEDGVLRVVQHRDLRVVLRRLRPEGFERHRVVKWPDCSCFSKRVQDAKYNRRLVVFLLFILSFAVINLSIFEQLLMHDRPPDDVSTWDYIFNRTWLFGHFQIGFKGIIVLAMFAAILVVGVFMKKAPANISSAPPRREEVQTVSALVQQV